MSTRFAQAAFALALLAPGVSATPHIPGRGDDVIERLPLRADPARQELRRLRAQLAANPGDLALATGIARRYIQTARAETDPRYLGYAQAALAPWWNSPAPPPPVRLLRATLLQSTHHFPEALQDLDAVVAADPANAQAWLTRATVQTVRGEYAAATASCAHLSSLATELVSITCIASVAGMNGRAVNSEALLEATLRRAGDVEPALHAWVLTLLAELAGRRGDAALAEQRYRRALALTPRDSYLAGAYADFLLDQRRPREVLPLVRDHTRIDGLLLRYALALQQIPGQQQALRQADDELKARFAAAIQRGDSVHQREQARYELQLRGDSKAALALARKNWAVQKESADMRVLLEAALKAGDKPAAAPVLDWIRNNAVEDVALARLARQIAAGA
jgi:Tfp pilus assembly protein PilF